MLLAPSCHGTHKLLDFLFITESNFYNNQRQMYSPDWLGRSRQQSVFTRSFHTSAINSSQDDLTQDKSKIDKVKKQQEKVNNLDDVKGELYPDDEEEFKYWEANRRTRMYHDTEQMSESAYIDIVNDQFKKGFSVLKTTEPSSTEDKDDFKYSETDRNKIYHDTEQMSESAYIDIVDDQLKKGINDFKTAEFSTTEGKEEYKYSETDRRTKNYHDTEQMSESAYIDIVNNQLKKGVQDFKTAEPSTTEGKEEFKYSETDRRTELYHETEQMSESAYIDIVNDQLKKGFNVSKTAESTAENEEEFKYSEADRRTELYHNTEQMNESAYIDIVNDHLNQGFNQFTEDTSTTKGCQETANLSDTLTHTDFSGKLNMVDISSKPDTDRVAVAMATIKLGEKAFNLVKHNKSKKGDVLTVAQIAGITAAKHTSELIPLCHNIPLSKVNVDLKLVEESHYVVITSLAKAYGKTGVEMEAIMAASMAAITVYDMCKAVSRDMIIGNIKLVKKSGGMRGDYQLSKI